MWDPLKHIDNQVISKSVPGEESSIFFENDLVLTYLSYIFTKFNEWQKIAGIP